MSPIIFKNRILLTLLAGIVLVFSACFFEEEPVTPDAVFNAGEWSQIPPFPYNARGHVSFSIESRGKGYVGMFTAPVYNRITNTTTKFLLKELWEYDPAGSRWEQRAAIPGPWRGFGVSFGVGGKGYILTGFVEPASDSSDVYEYDPRINEWTKKLNPFPGRQRNFASSFVIGNKAYVGGGEAPDYTSLRDFWEYDPAKDSWRQVAPMPEEKGRRSAAAFSVDGKGYIVGGWGKREDIHRELRDVWEYNPLQDQWTEKASLASPRIYSVGFNVEKKGYIALGNTPNWYSDPPSSELLEYDPEADKWVTRARFPGEVRYGVFYFGVGGKGYIGAGNSSLVNDVQNFNDFHVYTPNPARPK
jgi:N-acetylneuraminic acid mutarotase